jgi:hypothetical protein
MKIVFYFIKYVEKVHLQRYTLFHILVLRVTISDRPCVLVYIVSLYIVPMESHRMLQNILLAEYHETFHGMPSNSMHHLGA